MAKPGSENSIASTEARKLFSLKREMNRVMKHYKVKDDQSYRQK